MKAAIHINLSHHASLLTQPGVPDFARFARRRGLGASVLARGCAVVRDGTEPESGNLGL
ncbi:MAG: hypothetical protein IPK50_07625 [Fibrobacterota bacterium]|nr:MAG: hypothetical protein IPK50_07625 [Fibrobacterota bacterium]